MCKHIVALNALYGGSNTLPIRGAGSRTSTVQQLVVGRIFAYCQKLACVRREFPLTGAQSTQLLMKQEEQQTYNRSPGKVVRQIRLISDRLAEPSVGSPIMDMLSCLPPADAAYYAKEENLTRGMINSPSMLQDLERQYGFLGGERAEWIN